MSLLLTILLFSAFSCVALAEESFPKVISQGVGLKGSQKPQGFILKTEAELSKFLNLPVAESQIKIKQILKVKELNFANQMILVIHGGECRSGGYKVAFEKFEISGLKVAVEKFAIKSLTLHVLWKLKPPPDDAFLTQALTYPSLVLLVDKHQGEIVFKQIIEKK